MWERRRGEGGEGRGGDERMGGVVVAHNIDQACFSSSLQNRYGHKLLTEEYKGASPVYACIESFTILMSLI